MFQYNYRNKGYLTFEPITLVPLQMKMIDPCLLTQKEVGICVMASVLMSWQQYRCHGNNVGVMATKKDTYFVAMTPILYNKGVLATI